MSQWGGVGGGGEQASEPVRVEVVRVRRQLVNSAVIVVSLNYVLTHYLLL